jgi:type I restriction enzyme M protein
MATTKKEKKDGTPSMDELFEQSKAVLLKLGFDLEQSLETGREEERARMAWARVKGVDTKRVFHYLVKPENWDKTSANDVETRMYEVLPTDLADDQYPTFAFVSDGGARTKCFDLSYPAHEIDQLPNKQESLEYEAIKRDPTHKWSLRQYDRLMNGFNSFHEQVYQTVKDRVNGKNDIIEEVCKFLYLESFRLNHEGEALAFKHEGQTLHLGTVFTTAYVREHEKKAVAEIQAAFDHFKGHPDYAVTDDAGERHPIFDRNTHLQLEQPRNYVTLLDLLQDLGPVTDNKGRTVKKQGTLKDVSNDALGRAFDVFLRGNFDSKGGLGIYLTPAPVKDAIMEMVFHDIKEETPEILTGRRADGTPIFRACDPAGGSAGFLVKMLGYLERALYDLSSKEVNSDAGRARLLQDIKDHSIVGADAAPMMVTLARVNMALMGAPKAHIFYTQNSLITDQLKPCSFDLVVTNPPFGTPKFTKNQGEARKRYEEEMEKILVRFRTDLVSTGKTKESYTYEPTVAGKAMGAKPDNKGIWKPVKPASIDPAVLFIDRCLELLKPGGRLLIILPDGVLCNSGDRYVREYIMGKKDEKTGEFHGGKAIVKAVISLPADAFKLSGTGAKTSILYLQKRHARTDDAQHFQDEPQTDVFMAVADTLGYEVKNNVEDYSKGLANDLALITGAYVRGE